MPSPPAGCPRPRNRFTRQKAAGIVLTERDREILSGVFLHRAMRRDQIEALYFGSTPRANARLRLLFDHGLLMRSFPPEAPFGAQAVYTIALAAVPAVAAHLEWDEAEVRATTRKSPTPRFLEHTLAIVEFYLALRRDVAATPGLALEKWLPEILCRQEYEARRGSTGAWCKEVFRPDAFARLRVGERVRDVFLEIDLGHTSRPEWERKLASYAEVLQSGLFEETYRSEAFSLLVVTTGPRRAQHLASLKAPILVQLTTLRSVATDGGALAPLGADLLSPRPLLE